MPFRKALRRRFNAAMRQHCLGILRGLGWPQCGGAAPRTLGLTSNTCGAGVSSLAAHLALAAASCAEGRVALVDCNLASPSVARTFGVAPYPGLVERLSESEADDEVLQACSVQDLRLLTAGQLHGKPARVYHSPRLPGLVEALAAEFSLAIFDMPPVAQASCMRSLAGLLDGVLLVVEAGRAGWESAARAKELLKGANAHLLGAVLNKPRAPRQGVRHRTQAEKGNACLSSAGP